MSFEDLTENKKNEILKTINEKYPNTNINIDNIKIDRIDDSLEINYKDINIKIPIGKPDQTTTNGIWQTLTGGAIAIASVATVLFLSKDSKS